MFSILKNSKRRRLRNDVIAIDDDSNKKSKSHKFSTQEYNPIEDIINDFNTTLKRNSEQAARRKKRRNATEVKDGVCKSEPSISQGIFLEQEISSLQRTTSKQKITSKQEQISRSSDTNDGSKAVLRDISNTISIQNQSQNSGTLKNKLNQIFSRNIASRSVKREVENPNNNSDDEELISISNLNLVQTRKQRYKFVELVSIRNQYYVDRVKKRAIQLCKRSPVETVEDNGALQTIEEFMAEFDSNQSVPKIPDWYFCSTTPESCVRENQHISINDIYHDLFFGGQVNINRVYVISRIRKRMYDKAIIKNGVIIPPIPKIPKMEIQYGKVEGIEKYRKLKEKNKVLENSITRIRKGLLISNQLKANLHDFLKYVDL